MTYTKPEITVLGDAVSLVQSNKALPSGEGQTSSGNPAYELDE
jgi:hypothetical protein